MTTTKEKILEAAEKCPQAKETLKSLFPEVFDNGTLDKFRKQLGDFLWREVDSGIANQFPGSTREEAADSIIKAFNIKSY